MLDMTGVSRKQKYRNPAERGFLFLEMTVSGWLLAFRRELQDIKLDVWYSARPF
jgi:hypothetical protein